MPAFNNKKYLELQAQKISERISKFNNKLYLEFGGKIFDDYHASRVLPGFASDSKVKMLLGLKDKVEIIITINAKDIQTSKMRGDHGISYEDEVFRMIEQFNKMDLYVGSVVITRYNSEPAIEIFKRKLAIINIPVYFHYAIAGYPEDTDKILEELGYKKRSVQENKRIRYILNDVEIDIDTWPHLNTYVEFESDSLDKIKEVINLLGFDYNDAVTDDADDIYMSLGYTREDLNNLKF
jgi:uncharacterized protein (UPF0371 family)